jgi:hypothetical protein
MMPQNKNQHVISTYQLRYQGRFRAKKFTTASSIMSSVRTGAASTTPLE